MNTLKRNKIPAERPPIAKVPAPDPLPPVLMPTARERDLVRLLDAANKLDERHLADLRWIAEQMPTVQARMAAITAASTRPTTATPREHIACAALVRLMLDLDRVLEVRR